MKLWKPLALFLIGLAAIALLSQFNAASSPQLNTQTKAASSESANALAATYRETCLSVQQETRPVWECYEVSVDIPIGQPVVVQHQSGEQYKVLSFTEGKQNDEQTKFRFTPTQRGTWTFSSNNREIGQVTINTDRPDYAKGFVTATGSKWTRSATGEAFVPQYVMYNKPNLDEGLTEFVDGLRFTGFHIKNLRDFLDNPEYFEAAVLKTYRRGGATHFWIWGDEARNTTPNTYGVDVNRLYTEIAARLAPLPGWTLGYGFDLFEWATAEELEDFRAQLINGSDYHHLIGARGYKNEYREISTQLDYVSWEWHHPSYQDYREHLKQADGRPVFSEDRFRIQVPDSPQHYSPEETYRGLWHSALAGGIANIWGNRPKGKEFSEPYLNSEQIQTVNRFIQENFNVRMEPDNSLISDGYCLRDADQLAICYSQQPETVTFKLESLAPSITSITVVDAKSPYEETEVDISDTPFTWIPPSRSDWAFKIVSN